MVVSARNGILTLYDGEKSTPFTNEGADYLKKSEVYTSMALSDGSICITTIRGGLVILEHDGRLRRIISKDAGLQNQNVLTTFVDHEGALWLGLGLSVTRVEINSPISIFSRDSSNDVIRFNGSRYVADAGGSVALNRIVPIEQPDSPRLRRCPIQYRKLLPSWPGMTLLEKFRINCFVQPAAEQ